MHLVSTLPMGARAKNPRTVFRALTQDHKGPAFFFERGQKTNESLQIVESVLAVDPFETFTSSQGKTHIENSVESLELGGSPFDRLQERLDIYKPYHLPNSDSFQNGALGYFSYDCARYIEDKLTQGPGNLAKDSDQCDAEFMFFKQLIVFNHARSEIKFIVAFTPYLGMNVDELNDRVIRESNQLLERLEEIYINTADRPKSAVDGDVKALDVTQMESMLGREHFIQSIQTLKGNIRAGDIFQAVLSEQFRTPFAGDAFSLFETLIELNPAPYQFYFSTGKRTVLGASPEMLLKIQDQTLESHPIAGTRPSGKTLVEQIRLRSQLLRSSKEKSEHLMLVDLARNDLGRVSSSGSVRLDTYMKVRNFGAVMHLVSKVKSHLKEGIPALSALAACFPAGTLSGAPKIRAMQILSELEPKRRGFYGGAVVAAGFDGNLESCIAIRSVCIENGHALIQAGAGVVADSRPEREYQEILNKTQSVRQALALALKNRGVRS